MAKHGEAGGLPGHAAAAAPGRPSVPFLRSRDPPQAAALADRRWKCRCIGQQEDSPCGSRWPLKAKILGRESKSTLCPSKGEKGRMGKKRSNIDCDVVWHESAFYVPGSKAVADTGSPFLLVAKCLRNDCESYCAEARLSARSRRMRVRVRAVRAHHVQTAQCMILVALL